VLSRLNARASDKAPRNPPPNQHVLPHERDWLGEQITEWNKRVDRKNATEEDRRDGDQNLP